MSNFDERAEAWFAAHEDERPTRDHESSLRLRPRQGDWPPRWCWMVRNHEVDASFGADRIVRDALHMACLRRGMVTMREIGGAYRVAGEVESVEERGRVERIGRGPTPEEAMLAALEE